MNTCLLFCCAIPPFKYFGNPSGVPSYSQNIMVKEANEDCKKYAVKLNEANRTWTCLGTECNARVLSGEVSRPETSGAGGFGMVGSRKKCSWTLLKKERCPRLSVYVVGPVTRIMSFVLKLAYQRSFVQKLVDCLLWPGVFLVTVEAVGFNGFEGYKLFQKRNFLVKKINCRSEAEIMRRSGGWTVGDSINFVVSFCTIAWLDRQK